MGYGRHGEVEISDALVISEGGDGRLTIEVHDEWTALERAEAERLRDCVIDLLGGGFVGARRSGDYRRSGRCPAAGSELVPVVRRAGVSAGRGRAEAQDQRQADRDVPGDPASVRPGVSTVLRA